MHTFDPFDTTDDQTANTTPMVAPEREPADLDELGTGTGYQTAVGVGDRNYNSTVVAHGYTEASPTGRLDDPMGTGYRLDSMTNGNGDGDNGDGFDPTTYQL